MDAWLLLKLAAIVAFIFAALSAWGIGFDESFKNALGLIAVGLICQTGAGVR